jgi:hypothetical protein
MGEGQLDRMEAKLDKLQASLDEIRRHFQIGSRPRHAPVDIQEWAKKQLRKKTKPVYDRSHGSENGNRR